MSGYKASVIVKGVSMLISVVWPSGLERATWVAPMLPDAPETFSTTTLCFSVVVSRAATRRAMTSSGPPGGKLTMILTAFSGKSAAYEGVADMAASPTRPNPRNTLRRVPMMGVASRTCMILSPL